MSIKSRIVEKAALRWNFQKSMHQNTAKIPPATKVIEHAKEMEKITAFNDKLGLGLQKEQNVDDQLKAFTRSLNHRYIIDQRKGFAFEDSVMLYTWFLANPNAEERELVKVMNYIYDKYLFRQLPEVMGCIIGRLLIYRIFNPEEKAQISKTIDFVYTFSKRDRTFCDMSKMVYLALMDVWNRWGNETLGWGHYDGWTKFKNVQEMFWKLAETDRKEIRQIWVQFGLRKPTHEHEIAELLRRLSDFRDLTAHEVSVHLFCFVFLLDLMLQEHKHVNKYSDELINTLGQILSKLCYLPLNPWFMNMNAFLILYKLAVKEKEILGSAVLKLHMSVRAAQFFYKKYTEKGKSYIAEFKQKIHTEQQLTAHYAKLDSEVEHTIELQVLTQQPAKFFSYGQDSFEERKSFYASVHNTLHSKSGKLSDSEARVCRSLIRSRPEILSYAEQRVGKLEYIELYLSLGTIHAAFMTRLEEMCKLETNVEERHRYVRYLYTWFAGAYLMVIKEIYSENNLLLMERFMSQYFVQQFQAELISRMAELAIIDIDFQKVYQLLYEEYEIEGMLVLDLGGSSFGVREVFEAVERMGWNVGSSIAYYELGLLRSYWCGQMVSGGKNHKGRDLRNVVERVLQKKELIVKRPETKFIKPEQPAIRHQTIGSVSQTYDFPEQIKYPVYYDGHFHLIKTTIYRLLQKLSQSSLRPNKSSIELLTCIVTVLDSEDILLDIYANLMFGVVNSGEDKLVEWGYAKMALMRRALSDKWRSELPCGKRLANGMLSVYERLRKIELKKTKKSKSKTELLTRDNGKTKLLPDDDNQKHPTKSRFPNISTQPSKIYEQYFENLFQTDHYEILHYGKQLAGMRKHREAVYVLQVVGEKLERMRARQELDLDQEIDVDWKELEVKNIQCEIALCECYAVLVCEFRLVQNSTMLKVVQERIDTLKRECPSLSLKEITQKLHPQPQIPNTFSTLISELTNMIKLQYFKQNKFYFKERNVPGRDHESLKAEAINLQYRLYSLMTNYAMGELSKVNTRQQFKVYYMNLIMGAVLHKWYRERVLRLMGRWDQEEEEIDEEVLVIMQGDNKMVELTIEPEKEIFHKTFEDILMNNLPLVFSPADRLKIMELVYYFEELDQKKTMKTVRAHNEAILESNNMQIIFDLCYRSYGGENYEFMPLVDLQILQRYYFERMDYQQVKSITKQMLHQRLHMLYSQKSLQQICWPRVFGYDLQAKLLEGHSSSDMVIGIRWDEFLKLIEDDTEVLVEGKKVKLVMLKNPNYLQEMRAKQPLRLGKAQKELETKIKQYFKLLRIIFDMLNLQCKVSINIFLILQKIYYRFFIPDVTPAHLFTDFFYYYLRFLCQSVNCEWFQFQESDQFKKGMKAIFMGKYVNVSIMDQAYVVQITTNTVVMLLQNVKWVKEHFSYLVRAFGGEKDGKKNFILRKLIVETILNNPAEHLWNIAFLKHYSIKFPFRFIQNQPSIPRTHKFQYLSNFQYDSDSLLNKRHDIIIAEIYAEIEAALGDKKIESLLEIPQAFMEILERNACQRAKDINYTFSDEKTMMLQVKEINGKIKQSHWRIPYPLDTRFYIRSLDSFNFMGTGKSVPTNFDFWCRPYSQVKGDLYVNEKNVQMTVDDTLKSFILKYNFSREDFMVEPASANFYNEMGMLDNEMTYKIVNMSKYILMIEKIHMQHTTMLELMSKACNIEGLDRQGIKYTNKYDFRYGNQRAATLMPMYYDKIKIERHNPLLEDNQISLFRSFYKQGLQKHRSIQQWWRYINNFVRTMAQWSYLCYLTKLGDRHGSNILVTATGKLIHIDYEYNFAHGLMLACPEWVPFRLTDALVSVMGVFQEKGIFYGYFLDMAKRFDVGEERTWKALGNFQPDQRKLIQSAARFEMFGKNSTVQENCFRLMDTSRSDTLLRQMYHGWLSIV